MASVGISIPPQDHNHVTSPVATSKPAFNGHDGGRRFEAFARRNSGHGGHSERTASNQRLMRKRSWSMHGDWRGLKRRRKGIVPPTKFLLGGNICDPLNLGSLNDEEANRIANANTPVSSPMPTPKYRKEPIEVIIPPDISDPLGLNGPDSLLSPAAQRRKRCKRRRKQLSGHGASEPAGRSLSESSAARSSSDGDTTALLTPVSAPVTTGELSFSACSAAPAPVPASAPAAETAETAPVASAAAGAPDAVPTDAVDGAVRPSSLCVSVEPAPVPSSAAAVASPVARPARPTTSRRSSDEVVSPALPQPGGRPAPFARAGPAPPEMPVFRPRDEAFQYGNYNRYYGYRNPEPGLADSRLSWLKREWFSGLDVLDVGCNVGHVTLTVARDYQPRRCVGVDIDSSLIKAARRNVKHYQRADGFPASMQSLYGDLRPAHKAPGTQFPRNVSFQHANFVLESDALLDTVKPEFDTVLCLSITKWIHLNFGDAGIRRFFRRAFLSLRPGGRLLLEPQPWPSYVKKKKLTKRIWENYHQIRLRPENFPDLLINEIGFERYQTVGRPHHSSHGFSRQLQLFTKAKEPAATSTVTSMETTEAAPSAATVAMDTTVTPAEKTPALVAMDTDTASAPLSAESGAAAVVSGPSGPSSASDHPAPAAGDGPQGSPAPAAQRRTESAEGAQTAAESR
ncbi:7SK snRNA methylphosphate capping enzyme [Amphibalanus amphitrite]|uniref:RNA methyltransferase n=1 Tax=Amphibalanus amphitrite TaxID=1232801 RepID=A0A6A4WF52_AMPAM|nr:7SK snRNA methylphosphate capping enzyme [Amphibalanus amphitrite]